MKKAKSPPSSPPQALLVIDPNIRVVNNETYVGFEDIREGEVPSVGEVVRVLEEESGLEGLGEVTRLDHERSLIFLSISWRGLRFVSGPKAREIPAPRLHWMRETVRDILALVGVPMERRPPNH